MRCKACDRKMDFKKKRPITTYSGEVNSVYSDRIEDFPRREVEDLCPTCVSSIRDYNFDMNKDMEALQPEQHYCEDLLKGEIEESEVRLDIQFEMVESVYQGFSDY